MYDNGRGLLYVLLCVLVVLVIIFLVTGHVL